MTETNKLKAINKSAQSSEIPTNQQQQEVECKISKDGSCKLRHYYNDEWVCRKCFKSKKPIPITLKCNFDREVEKLSSTEKLKIAEYKKWCEENPKLITLAGITTSQINQALKADNPYPARVFLKIDNQDQDIPIFFRIKEKNARLNLVQNVITLKEEVEKSKLIVKPKQLSAKLKKFESDLKSKKALTYK